MNTTTKSLAALVVLAIAGFGAYHFLGKKDAAKTPDSSEVSAATEVPAPKRAHSDKTAPPSMERMQTQIDDDPVGDLLLQGQVVDENGAGVAGALVFLGSAPARTTTSEDDGSFSFDKLVQRRYPVSARSESRIGGPVMVTLSASSDPVLVRMEPGGGLRVEVVDVDNTPIQSATVSIPVMASVEATTDAKGVAVIENLPPGTTMVSVTAKGYAKTHSMTSVPRSADTLGQQRVTLERGVVVTGRVVDHQGNPVAQASVIAMRSGSLMQVENPRKDGVKSDADGNFQLPAVPGGNVQLLAVHDRHAPSTSERFEVGDAPVVDIKLAMRQGASVAGQVTLASGDAAAWATVRVGGKADTFGGGGGVNRQMIADQEGRFTIEGLPREKLGLYAASEEASSASVEVDLRTSPDAKKIKLLLDVEGMIQGIVVDEEGEAIAEAQVLAVPDFWDGADMQEMRVRGPAFATSRGDGSFTIKGLPDSKYKVSASRGVTRGGGFQQGASAKTGDTGVKVVLATPATVVGRIKASDGTVPEIATVSIGWANSVPVTDGKFVINDVNPGSHELTVRGPDFAATHSSKVEVKAGEEHDVGTIEVRKGRRVSGRILDTTGSPVAGASVVLAKQVVSDGANLTPKSMGTAMDERMGNRRTTSNDEGLYSLRGIGPQEVTIVADHPSLGRSVGALVSKGEESVELDLGLMPVGGVKGTVTVNDEPVAGLDVLITSESGSAHIVIVKSDERGEFLAERVAVGKVKVSAMRNSGGSSSMAATKVTVEPNDVALATLEITEGSIGLAVSVRGIDDVTIDAAQVFLFRGVADVKTGAELNKLFLSAASNAKMSFAFGKASANFDKISPSDYSVCIIPINGDMNDPSFAQKLQRNVGEIAVYCQRLKITDTPDNQTYEARVPQMTPLPED